MVCYFGDKLFNIFLEGDKSPGGKYMKKIYGIGLGPGDEELITMKAYNLIKACDYIFVPKSKGKSLAKSIVSKYTSEKNIIELDFSMGEDNTAKYEDAAQKINSIVKDQQIAVYLTIGDPMVYSTYIYLMYELQKFNIQVETVPGIASFNAAACCLNIPITIKDESFYLCDRNVDEKILQAVDSICILKVNQNKRDIINKLEKHHFSYVYIKRCMQEEQEIIYDKNQILLDDDYMSLIFARKKLMNHHNLI